MKGAVALACALAAAAPSWAEAQARYDASGRRVPDRRGNDELGALMLTAGTYGFRSGTMLNYALDLRADDSWAYWVAPSLLGAASLVGAVLIERRFPMRRGRGLSAGTAMLLGQVGTFAFELYRRGESFPSPETFTAPISWVGATAGLAAGIALGHLLDVKPGQAVYVGIGGVGGALVGLFSCGLARCSTDVGAWALTGLGVGTIATLATAWWANPPQREMRAMAAGGIAGVLPAAGLLLAYQLRDGVTTQDAWVRVSAVGLAGVLGGAAFGYALSRSSRDIAPAEDGGGGVSFAPTFERNGAATTVGFGAFGTL